MILFYYLYKMEQHVQVPHDMCKDGKLDPTDVLVYACLKRHMNNISRETYTSVNKMVDKFNISRSTIIRSINKLIDNNDISVRKLGRKNVYKFNPNNRNFEMFTCEFLENKDMSLNKKAYLIMMHQPMMEKESGIGKVSYTDKELEDITGLSRFVIKRRENELIEDGVLTSVPMEKIDPETGLFVNLKLYDLQKIGQAVLYVKEKIEEHDQRLDKQDKTLDIVLKRLKALEDENAILKGNKTINTTLTIS